MDYWLVVLFCYKLTYRFVKRMSLKNGESQKLELRCDELAWLQETMGYFHHFMLKIVWQIQFVTRSVQIWPKNICMIFYIIIHVEWRYIFLMYKRFSHVHVSFYYVELVLIQLLFLRQQFKISRLKYSFNRVNKV